VFHFIGGLRTVFFAISMNTSPKNLAINTGVVDQDMLDNGFSKLPCGCHRFFEYFRGRCSTSHIFRQLVKKIQKRKRGKEKGKKESPKWKVEESKEKNSSLFIKKTVWWSMFECEFRKEGKRFSS